jgi:hypothetical protein
MEKVLAAHYRAGGSKASEDDLQRETLSDESGRQIANCSRKTEKTNENIFSRTLRGRRGGIRSEKFIDPHHDWHAKQHKRRATDGTGRNLIAT